MSTWRRGAPTTKERQRKFSSSRSQSTGSMSRDSREDITAKLEQWKREAAAKKAQEKRRALKKEQEKMDIEGKYCVGSECDLYVKKFCTQENLDTREAGELMKFVNFAKRQGLVRVPVSDARTLCRVWKEKNQ